MPLVINSNISSLNSQRQLVKSGMEMDQAMERLSSGKRINSAADDAAGLAISNRMTSQVNGLNRAVSNANDGISLIQTAEGALDESTNILQRMRELSIQSANGIYSDGDRATLNAEVQQLVAELNRISETTSFNGQKLLDGGLGSISLQVGSEANQTISFSIDAMNASTLGLGSTSSDLASDRITSTTTTDIADGAVLINGQALSAVTNLNGAGATDTQLQDILDDINQNISGVSASGFNVAKAGAIGDGVLATGETFTITLSDPGHGADTAYVINGGSDTTTLQGLVDAVNAKTNGAVVASIADDGKMVLSNSTGGKMALAETAAGTLATLTGFTDTSFEGQIALTSDNGSAISVTKGAVGTDADLASLGFREIAGAGKVTGSAVAAANQDDGLSANELKINGVAIAASPSAADSSSLQEIVTTINDVTDTTGVTAKISAAQSFTANLSKAVAEVEATTGIGTTTASDLIINGVAVTLAANETALTAATKINAATTNTGVSAYVDSNGFMSLVSEGAFTLSGANAANLGTGISATTFTTSLASASTTGSLTINGTQITGIDLTTLDLAIADINAATANTGVTASVDDNGELKLSANSSISLEMGDVDGMTTLLGLGLASNITGFVTDANDGLVASTTNADAFENKLVIAPRIELDSLNNAPISIEVTTEGAAATGLKNLNTGLSSTVTGSALSSISVATQAGANAAVSSIDNALETINATRSELGAVSNRLDFTVSNLMNISENTASARSRIVDADFAAETAALSRAQVLQQASQAMLAQANAAPAQVLSLLR